MTVRQISLEHSYEASARSVWDLVTDFDALAQVNAPRVVMTGLPAGRIVEGQIYDVTVSLFGRLPAQPYRMQVVICDDEAHHFRSSEHGAGVRTWEHDLRVVSNGSGCQIKETITIDAGVLTPLFVLWARYLYKARHPVRVRLLSEKRDANDP